MKKILFLCCIGTLLAACTTKEQDEQIQNFWNQQIEQVVLKMMEKNMPAAFNPTAVPVPAVPSDIQENKEMQEMEEMMKQWEQVQTSLEQAENAPQATIEQPIETVLPEPVPTDSSSIGTEPPAASQEAAPAVQSPAPKAQTSPAAPRKAPVRRSKNRGISSGQFMEITLEDSPDIPQGKAPLKDRQAMQRAIDKVMQDNQKTIQDIGQIFGPDAQAEVFVITTKTEKVLYRQAKQSISLQAYLKVQKQVLKQQEQSLNQLIEQYVQAVRRR